MTGPALGPSNQLDRYVVQEILNIIPEFDCLENFQELEPLEDDVMVSITVPVILARMLLNEVEVSKTTLATTVSRGLNIARTQEAIAEARRLCSRCRGDVANLCPSCHEDETDRAIQKQLKMIRQMFKIDQAMIRPEK